MTEQTMRAARAALLCVLLAVAAPAAAGGPGTTSFDFLKIGIGPRQIGMGGATAAVLDDLNAAFYNPAALGHLGRQEAAAEYARWFDSISYQHLAYAQPVSGFGTFAGGFDYLSWGNIPGYDAQGLNTGSFGLHDLAATFGWGKELSGGLTAGANAKYVQETLESVSGGGPALDLGVAYRPQSDGALSRLEFGAAMRNLGPSVRFIQDKEPLPWIAEGGVSYRPLAARALTVAFDVRKWSDEGAAASLGGEYWVRDVLAVRAGYQSGQDLSNGLSAGFGIRLGEGQFDYALMDFGALGITHRLGLTYRFGGNAEALYQRGLRQMRQGRYEEAILDFDKALMLKPGYRDALLELKASHQKLVEEQGGKPAAPPPAADSPQ